jgi:hypothetical protein
MFNVHPVSMTGDYLRQSFIGTQEEIYKGDEILFEIRQK